MKLNVVIVVFVGAILTFTMRTSSENEPVQTVKLSKIPTGYVVSWVTNSNVILKETFDSLDAARNFIQKFDGFDESSPKVLKSSVKYSKIISKGNKFLLVWGIDGELVPYQLTFASLTDAQYFEMKLKNGDYVRSSFGHAVNIFNYNLPSYN